MEDKICEKAIPRHITQMPNWPTSLNRTKFGQNVFSLKSTELAIQARGGRGKNFSNFR